MPLPSRTRYVSENDFLILEDELQRILLIGNINAGEVFTGIIVAFLVVGAVGHVGHPRPSLSYYKRSTLIP